MSFLISRTKVSYATNFLSSICHLFVVLVIKLLYSFIIRLFHGDHFFHNCVVAYLSKHGAPMVTTNNKLVGMCDSGSYHPIAKIIFTLLGVGCWPNMRDASGEKMRESRMSEGQSPSPPFIGR